MADLDTAATTTTSLKTGVKDFKVVGTHLDEPDYTKEIWYDFPEADTYLNYYKKIPELKAVVDTLALWSMGKGVTTSARNQSLISNWSGWGEDTFMNIFWNLQVQKKVFGDAFAEIIRNDKGIIINLKPLYVGNMRVVANKQGIIIRYEHRVGQQPPRRFEPKDIFHVCNERIANEIHGTSMIEALQDIIDARNEALSDERKIRHRELALGVLKVDSDDATKITEITNKYKDAVKNGEVLVLPKDVAELEDNANAPRDRIQWLQYLDSFFYTISRVPKAIVNAEGFSEASSKTGFMTFEPVYTKEQVEMEEDIWNQLAIRLKFNRPPSLHGVETENEQKNTGQIGIQPNETQLSVGRTE